VTRRSALRASDLDRELVADRLRDATAEGRIGAEELEERLGAALSARTYRQLNALVSDLPVLEGEGTGMPVWATASLGFAGAVGMVTAAATAAALFAGIAGASVAWAFVGRVFFGRRRRPAPRAHAPALRLPARPQLAARPQLTARRQLAARGVRAGLRD
jgi:hypothetical protein